MFSVALTEREFSRFRALLFEHAGIHLSSGKSALVAGRLAGRLRALSLDSFGDYLRLIDKDSQQQELQACIDLLTTNETRFFREPKHFEMLASLAREHHKRRGAFRVWSAASSSGEEPYTIAMVLQDVLGDSPWEVLGSDLSTRVLEQARNALYPMERARDIPEAMLRRYCLKGVGSQKGTFLIDPRLCKRVTLRQIKLHAPIPALGQFDVIFLRNVMIYFNWETKREVVARLLPALKRDGYFITGHSETLNGLTDTLTPIAPSIYRRSRLS